MYTVYHIYVPIARKNKTLLFPKKFGIIVLLIEGGKTNMAKYLLFDLDGTLTDPGVGITNAVRYALEKFGVHPASREELYPYIGPPLIESFQRYQGMTPDRAKQALADYREYFSATGIFENELYPGIADVLSRLRGAGYTLIVATSKPEEFTHRILEHFGLSQYFDFVGGNTLDESRPTKESVIAYIREQYPEMREDTAWMIGDRRYDVEGAHACGLPAIGVTYGYGSREELIQAGAEALATDPEDLYRVIVGGILH